MILLKGLMEERKKKTEGIGGWNLPTVADGMMMLLASIYILYQITKMTTFFLPYPSSFEKVCFAALLAAAVFRMVEHRLWKNRDFFPAIFMAAVYIMVYSVCHFSFFLFLAVLTLGFLDIDAGCVLKIFTVVLGFSLLVTFLSALGGAIENFVYMKDGRIRSSLGICYPTDMASAMLFFTLMTWTAWKSLPVWSGILMVLWAVWFSHYVAMSETSTICGILMTGMIFLMFMEETFPRFRIGPDVLKRLFRYLVIFSFPLLACLMFFLMLCYAKGIGAANIANNILSSRLLHAVNAFREYGLKPFGTPFDQIGNGFSTFAQRGYNFVDSTYPLILIRYGWVLFLAVCIFWPSAVRKSLSGGDRRVCLAMVLIAFHSFSEHHFIETNFNPLMVLLFAHFGFRKDVSPVAGLNREKNYPGGAEFKFPFTAFVFALASFLLVLFCLPGLLSRMRTVVEIMGWVGGGRNGLYVIAALTGVILLSGTAVFCLYKLASGTGVRRRKAFAGTAVVCGILMGAGLWKCDMLIRHVTVRYQDLLDEDRMALERILPNADGAVYSDLIPEMYRKQYPGIRASFWKGDDVARLYNATVIMDRQYDSACLINSGFLFAPISEAHAVYTNDEKLISRLQAQGIHFTGYYNVEKKVDLKWMSDRNQLKLAQDGIILSGPKHSMIYGPYYSLYSGRYTVKYRLNISEEEKSREGNIGRLRVSAYYGQEIMKEQTISAKLFDEQGIADIEIPFRCGNVRGVEFLAFLEDGHELTIEEISYGRSPAYDIHSFYDSNRLKYREEYYDLSGNAVETTQGYSFCEYGYNYDRKVNEIRYYDAENKPVIITEGYASLKRKLDTKNRIIREEYYDTEGNLTLCRRHFAVNERDYDGNSDPVIERFLGTDGKAIITNGGYAEVHRKYNEKKQVIREEYFGTDGKRILLGQGYAITETDRDVSGRAAFQRYYDVNGEPVITTMGYAGSEKEYNSKDQVVREVYHGVDGDILILPQGYAGLKREYDSRGNAVVMKYLDRDDRLVMTKGGYAEIHREYNSRNWVSYESYFDEHGNPVLLPRGYAAWEKEYDGIGNPVVTRFFGLEGEPVMVKGGYHEIRVSYGADGNQKEQLFFDLQGKEVKKTN